MKLHNSLATLAVAAIAFIASAADTLAGTRTLILLQESSNAKSYMTDSLPSGPVRTAADAIIDQFVPNGELARFQSQVGSYYQRIVNLSDAACTRGLLLHQLIKQTAEGYTIDLVVLGHGNRDALKLGDGAFLTGQTTAIVNSQTVIIPGSIRTLLTEARALQGSAFNFRLRLVYMGNSFSATTNDDWLAIGAKVAVGVPQRNWAPEPMITNFWQGFLKEFKEVKASATDSLAMTRAIWSNVPTYPTLVQGNGLTRIQETQQTVSGNGSLISQDEYQFALNQSKSLGVAAFATYSGFVYLVAGQTYTFSVDKSDTWVNGTYGPLDTAITTTADGYKPWPGEVTRFPANVMCLIGELFRRPQLDDSSRISGGSFAIGTSRTFTPTVSGWLYLYANELTDLRAAIDNSGEVKVTITRIPTPILVSLPPVILTTTTTR